MWHEARKGEKRVQGMMVDMQKRAERRRAYYDKLGEDPMQLLRMHGTACNIHLEPSIARAAESSTVMVPLRCDANILIDRWDVRASMDIIPTYKSDPSALPEMDFAEQQCNYERYRVLVQKKFKGVEEEGHLQYVDMEELYPKSKAARKAEKKKLSSQKAAIGYRYDDGATPSAEQEAAAAELAKMISKPDVGEASAGATATPVADGNSSDEEDSLSNRDPPIVVNPDDAKQNADLNRIGLSFGLSNFTSMVTSEIMDDKMNKEAEEKGNALAAISSRASRRNRHKRIELRREKDQLLMSRPSYAQRASPTYDDYNPDGSDGSDDSRSQSRSLSPAIEIISGFSGGAASFSSASPAAAASSSSTSSVTASSSHRHGEAASWSSGHRRHSSPERSRQHRYRSRSPRDRSPHSRSRRSDESHQSHHDESHRHRESRGGSYRARSRSQSRDRDRDRDRHRGGRSQDRSPGRSPDHSHSRSRHRSCSRSPHGSERSHRYSPDLVAAERPSAKQPVETGALAAAKKLIQSKGSEKPKLTPQERLKLKMQLQLARTQKTDRAKVATKAEKEEQGRQDRMDEMMERSRKQREKERRQRLDEDDGRYGNRSPSPDSYQRGYGRGASSYSGSSSHY